MGYYVSPRFLDKLAIHITKNFIDFPGVRVPLILGVHGKKGEGKSFQCELVFQKMGIDPVRMSAGELESPDAGDPVRLIRMRYREAAELVKVRGKMSVLLINDLDAGAGRVNQNTQYTVNTQLVNGTLMNIADNPTDVQLPGSYETEPIQRVPIIVTGNDFSTLYAPLIRDGRMEKFYWEPNSDDRMGIVAGIFGVDGLSLSDVQQLVSHFADQSIDFFGALRSRLYDEQVRQFIEQIGLGQISTYLVNATDQQRPLKKINMTLSHLIAEGELMTQETQKIHHAQLAKAYIRSAEHSSGGRNRTIDRAQSAVNITKIQTADDPIDKQNQYVRETQLIETVSLPPHINPHQILAVIDRVLLQGGKIRLEIATQREKAANSWRTWRWPQSPHNSTKAMEGIQVCLKEHPQSFIKLIGYNPQTQTRLMEELIVRPT